MCCAALCASGYAAPAAQSRHAQAQARHAQVPACLPPLLRLAEKRRVLSHQGGLCFSRAEPRHKQDIVRLLKDMGEVREAGVGWERGGCLAVAVNAARAWRGGACRRTQAPIPLPLLAPAHPSTHPLPPRAR